MHNHNHNVDDMRNSIRQKVDTEVDDSEGLPNRGSLLKDYQHVDLLLSMCTSQLLQIDLC